MKLGGDIDGGHPDDERPSPGVPEAPQPTFASLRAATRFDPLQAVVATVASDRDITVFVVCLEPGQELPRHVAPAELTLLVTRGTR